MIDYSWAMFKKPKDQNKTSKEEKVSTKVKKPLKEKTKLKAKTPVKKVSAKKSKAKRPKKELCIMPAHSFYKTTREEGLIRHEIFYGRKQRDLSIKYGLVIFIKPEQHTGNDQAIHMNKVLDTEIKQIAQKAFMEKYKDKDFLKEFGKNYI